MFEIIGGVIFCLCVFGQVIVYGNKETIYKWINKSNTDNNVINFNKEVEEVKDEIKQKPILTQHSTSVYRGRNRKFSIIDTVA